MFYTSIFLGHSLDLCSALKQIIQRYYTCILIGLIGCDLVSTTNSVKFTMAVGIIGTSLFSGGRPEASKCNLNFQGITWHHFLRF
jgi:hypothetical protein